MFSQPPLKLQLPQLIWGDQIIADVRIWLLSLKSLVVNFNVLHIKSFGHDLLCSNLHYILNFQVNLISNVYQFFKLNQRLDTVITFTN